MDWLLCMNLPVWRRTEPPPRFDRQSRYAPSVSLIIIFRFLTWALELTLSLLDSTSYLLSVSLCVQQITSINFFSFFFLYFSLPFRFCRRRLVNNFFFFFFWFHLKKKKKVSLGSCPALRQITQRVLTFLQLRRKSTSTTPPGGVFLKRNGFWLWIFGQVENWFNHFYLLFYFFQVDWRQAQWRLSIWRTLSIYFHFFFFSIGLVRRITAIKKKFFFFFFYFWQIKIKIDGGGEKQNNKTFNFMEMAGSDAFLKKKQKQENRHRHCIFLVYFPNRQYKVSTKWLVKTKRKTKKMQ